jgi:sugar phosphate isomerase/epimerase
MQGVDSRYEIHPGEDIHDGATFERVPRRGRQPSACNILYDPSHYVLQQLDYLDFIDIYHERIDVPRQGRRVQPDRALGRLWRLQSWVDRAGRFRSLGDGQVDFGGIFSKLAQYGYSGWAVLEWECCLKHPEDGAREGAPFIQRSHHPGDRKAFDDFAGGATDKCDAARR